MRENLIRMWTGPPGRRDHEPARQHSQSPPARRRRPGDGRARRVGVARDRRDRAAPARRDRLSSRASRCSCCVAARAVASRSRCSSARRCSPCACSRRSASRCSRERQPTQRRRDSHVARAQRPEPGAALERGAGRQSELRQDRALQPADRRRQKVANYAGVTVERKEGADAPAERAHRLDHRPARRLQPDAGDARRAITLEVIEGRRHGEPAPDAIVCVVDATNLRMNLRLVLELARSACR